MKLPEANWHELLFLCTMESITIKKLRLSFIDRNEDGMPNKRDIFYANHPHATLCLQSSNCVVTQWEKESQKN